MISESAFIGRMPRARTRIAAAVPSFYLDWLYALALSSLLTGITYPVGGMLIRPFYLLSILCIIATAQVRGLPRIPIRFATAFTLLFLAVQAMSAYRLGLANGIRETLQSGLLSIFVIQFLRVYSNLPIARLWRIFAFAFLGILAYSIVWHVANGYYFGWKHLDDIKVVFVLLPIMLICWISSQRSAGALLPIVVTILVSAIILFSGERKAILICIISLISFFGIGSSRLYFIIGVMVIIGLLILSADPSGYFSQQVASITGLDLFHGERFARGQITTTESLSNAARSFAFYNGINLWLDSPTIGIGMNAYSEIVRQQFAFLPNYLTQGIHGEFLRVLVELGLVGFFIYVSVWVSGFTRLFRHDRMGSGAKTLSFRRYASARTVLFITFLIYCIFEASDTLTLLAFLLAPHVDILVPARNAQARRAPAHK